MEFKSFSLDSFLSNSWSRLEMKKSLKLCMQIFLYEYANQDEWINLSMLVEVGRWSIQIKHMKFSFIQTLQHCNELNVKFIYFSSVSIL